MCGVDAGEPISSSGLATNTSRARGRPPRASRTARDRVQAREQAALHVGDAGAGRDAVVDRERALRGGPGVEHRVHVADAAGASARPDPRRRSRPTTVSPRPELVGLAASRSRRASRSRSARPAPDLVDAGLRVAAAVDVDEALEVGEVRRAAPPRRRAERRELGGRDEGGRSWPKSIERASPDARVGPAKIESPRAVPCPYRSKRRQRPTPQGGGHGHRARASRTTRRQGGLREPRRRRGRPSPCGRAADPARHRSRRGRDAAGAARHLAGPPPAPRPGAL